MTEALASLVNKINPIEGGRSRGTIKYTVKLKIYKDYLPTQLLIPRRKKTLNT